MQANSGQAQLQGCKHTQAGHNSTTPCASCSPLRPPSQLLQACLFCSSLVHPFKDHSASRRALALLELLRGHRLSVNINTHLWTWVMCTQRPPPCSFFPSESTMLPGRAFTSSCPGLQATTPACGNEEGSAAQKQALTVRPLH